MDTSSLIEYTILVVDDSMAMRQLISYTLQGAGYRVIEAVDGKDAVNKIKENKIDLVVSDLNMPNMNGMEFLKYLRDHDDFESTPLIMLTTEAQRSAIVTAKDIGITGWVLKPFDPKKLVDRVKKILQ